MGLHISSRPKQVEMYLSNSRDLENLQFLINERLHKVLKKYGLEAQSGSTPERGFVDTIFTLKSVLYLRKVRSLPTWAAFIDLVKAYDTINQSLILEILYKFGIPDDLIGVIK